MIPVYTFTTVFPSILWGGGGEVQGKGCGLGINILDSGERFHPFPSKTTNKNKGSEKKRPIFVKLNKKVFVSLRSRCKQGRGGGEGGGGARIREKMRD